MINENYASYFNSAIDDPKPHPFYHIMSSSLLSMFMILSNHLKQVSDERVEHWVLPSTPSSLYPSFNLSRLASCLYSSTIQLGRPFAEQRDLSPETLHLDPH